MNDVNRLTSFDELLDRKLRNVRDYEGRKNTDLANNDTDSD